MKNLPLIFTGKSLSKFARSANLGNGSTWPGHLALKMNPHFVRNLVNTAPHLKTIFIAGTNGKTTTSSLIKTVLEKNGKKVLQNNSGANLLNGIASTLLLNTNKAGKLNQDYAIFEVDENVLPLLLQEITPDYIILNNLFRDQLDRYGEVDSIAEKWKEPLLHLPKETTIILNADDPQIAFLGKDLKAKTLYFGVNSQDKKKQLEHAADSIYCPQCSAKLHYKSIVYSHLGDWSCSACKLTRPTRDLSEYTYFPLSGTYNQYNTLACVLLLQTLKFSDEDITAGLKQFTPAFGRQEIIKYKGRQIQIFLSKNPTGFNESLRTIKQLGAKNLLLVLNDNIADGKDISWIWDIDLEEFVENFENITISGERAYDMGLRMKYTERIRNQESGISVIEEREEAIKQALANVKEKETLYILPTYTAMLEIRKILTGRKIL